MPPLRKRLGERAGDVGLPAGFQQDRLGVAKRILTDQ